MVKPHTDGKEISVQYDLRIFQSSFLQELEISPWKFTTLELNSQWVKKYWYVHFLSRSFIFILCLSVSASAPPPPPLPIMV